MPKKDRQTPGGRTAWGWRIASFLGLVGAAGWFGMAIEAPGILERIASEDSADTSASFRVRRQEMELPAVSLADSILSGALEWEQDPARERDEEDGREIYAAAVDILEAGRVTGQIEAVIEEALPDEEGEKTESPPPPPPAILEGNSPPSAWLHTEMLRANRVRFYLNGTRDREDGIDLQGTIDFGDQTDTTFVRVPPYIDHLYADEGTYSILLRVEDSGDLQASVSLELVLKLILRMPRPDIEYERGYKSKPLDR
jgi:hypothetical protein